MPRQVPSGLLVAPPLVRARLSLGAAGHRPTPRPTRPLSLLLCWLALGSFAQAETAPPGVIRPVPANAPAPGGASDNTNTNTNTPAGPVAGVAGPGTETALEQFTGRQTRVVWVQDQTPAGNDTLARGRRLKLMGLDSREGQGERPLRAATSGYAKPLLTPDGASVVWSDHSTGKVQVLDWQSGQTRELCAGFALDTWADPVTSLVWVCVATRALPRTEFVYRDVRRVRLDQPQTSLPLWNQTTVGPDNFQLSADGLFAAGEFPWPHAGVADLTLGTWSPRATGCWAGLAPDNSGLAAVFDGPHRHWQLQSATGDRSWKVPLDGGAGLAGHEVFHPRWSNDPRFVVLSGPYLRPGKVNVISGGGPQVELHIGRFAPGYDRIEQWWQVTHNTRGDFHPDLWVEGGERVQVPAEVSRRSPPTRPGPPPVEPGLEFVWRNSRSANQLPPSGTHPARLCVIEPRGAACYDRHGALHLRGGWGDPGESGRQAIAACHTARRAVLTWALTPEEAPPTAAPPEGSRTTRPEATPARGEVGTVLEWLTAAGAPLWRVVQSGRRLELVWERQPEIPAGAVTLGELPATRPGLWVLAWEGESVRVLAPGERQPQTVAGVPPQLGPHAWEQGQWRLGSAERPAWRGRVEQVRCLTTRLDDESAARWRETWETELSGRSAVEQLQVRVRLVTPTVTPTLEEIAPYRRALVTHTVEVQEVLRGRSPGERLQVLRWGLLDGQAQEKVPAEAGAEWTLTLEPLDRHPELESERQMNDTGDFDLPLYYDVTPSRL